MSPTQRLRSGDAMDRRRQGGLRRRRLAKPDGSFETRWLTTEKNPFATRRSVRAMDRPRPPRGVLLDMRRVLLGSDQADGRLSADVRCTSAPAVRFAQNSGRSLTARSSRRIPDPGRQMLAHADARFDHIPGFPIEPNDGPVGLDDLQIDLDAAERRQAPFSF